MPPCKTTAAPLPTRKLLKRRVRIANLSSTERLPGPDGRIVEVERDGQMGDEVELDAFAMMRADSVGALVPVGWTREDVLEHEAKSRPIVPLAVPWPEDSRKA